MKKLLSLLTAGVCAAALCVPAFADGMVIEPSATEQNTVEFTNNNATIAKLSFKADSDPDNFYVGISTSWEDSRYAEKFADKDAYLFAIVTQPVSIPSASIPVFYLYDPFDEKDNVDLTTVHIYQELKGGLKDVTESFTVYEDSNGDKAFTIRTRTPGYYIISREEVDISRTPVSGEAKQPARIAASSSRQSSKEAAANASSSGSGTSKSNTGTGISLPSHK